MTDLLVTLLGGILAIVLGFFALRFITRWGGKQVAVVVALLVAGVYIPIAVLWWPGGDVFAIHLALYLVTVYMLGIITGHREARLAQAAPGQKTPWFHWGPAAIVSFFVVVIAADAIFITIAQRGLGPELTNWFLPKPETSDTVKSVFPGTVARDFQKKEALYNEYLAQVERQRARGWQVSYGWFEPAKPVVGERALLRARVVDREGRPVVGAEVQGVFQRPADSRLDQSFAMRPVDLGVYEAPIVLAEPGTWNLMLRVKRDDDVHELHATTSVAVR